MNDLATSHSICAETVPPRREFPKYVTRMKTRHGKVVFYYHRKKGAPRVRLRAIPGTTEFMEEYVAARAGKTKKTASFVYFATSGKRVKIGVSKNPKSRLGSLKTGSATKTRIYYVTPGDQAKERDLHRLFAKHRVNGEWFFWCQDIKDWIAADERSRCSHLSQEG